MSQEDDEKYPASAVSSWSGFVYQGKIALYHSLKLIHDTDSHPEGHLAGRGWGS